MVFHLDMIQVVLLIIIAYIRTLMPEAGISVRHK